MVGYRDSSATCFFFFICHNIFEIHLCWCIGPFIFAACTLPLYAIISLSLLLVDMFPVFAINKVFFLCTYFADSLGYLWMKLLHQKIPVGDAHLPWLNSHCSTPLLANTRYYQILFVCLLVLWVIGLIILNFSDS